MNLKTRPSAATYAGSTAVAVPFAGHSSAVAAADVGDAVAVAEEEDVTAEIWKVASAAVAALVEFAVVAAWLGGAVV